MLLDPRAPLIFGCVMILLLGAYLAAYHPMPGGLAAPHAPIEGLSALAGCRSCHAEGGGAGGCLSCHEEIRSQLDGASGYHGFLLAGKRGGKGLECAPCHAEHLGRGFELVNAISWKDREKALFDHPHAAYRLSGRHAALECGECHEKKARVPFALSRFPAMTRPRTFLGLTQECISCHEDVHAGGLSPECGTCHVQEAFRPAGLFDHSKHFPLTGGHDRVACARCHVIPAAGSGSTAAEPLLAFDRVRGKACSECHPSLHRAPLGADCERCHPGSAPSWAEGAKGMTPDAHALAGFRLAPPHDRVECGKCHASGLAFERKFPDPSASGYARREETCEGCHADAHRGQFRGRHDRCLDCHDRHGFVPSRYTSAEHRAVFGLEGAHAAVPCTSCHKADSPDGARVFAGTARDCKACHADPHGGQFAEDLARGDCTACHSSGAVTFAIRPFDHERRTGYALIGAHAKADCRSCHVVPAPAAEPAPGTPPAATARRYRGTPAECSECHRDVHRGQFREEGRVSCDRCHAPAAEWRRPQFDHNRQSRFPLDKTHAKVPCAGCHPTVRLPDRSTLVQYRPIGRRCEDCHAVDRR